MAEGQADLFGDASERNTGGSSTTSSGRQRDLNPLPEGVVEYLLGGIEAKSGELVWHLRDETAEEAGATIPEAAREQFELPEGAEYVSVESLVPYDVSDVRGIGTALRVPYDLLQASVEAGVLSEDELADMDVEPGDKAKWSPDWVESTPQGELGDVINGYHAESIVDKFGSDAKVSVRCAPNSKVTAAHKRYTLVSFYLSRAPKAAWSRERSRVGVGELTQSEFEDWCHETGNEEYL